MKKARTAKISISLALVISLALNVFASDSSTPLETLQTTETEQSQAYTASPIIEEDITKRGEYEKHFLCEDGSYIAASYPYAVHEQNENGEWVDIDNSLAFKDNRIENQSEANRVSFAPKAASSQIARLEKDGHTMEWSLTSLMTKQVPQAQLMELNSPVPAFTVEESTLNTAAKAKIETKETAAPSAVLTVEEANEEKMRLPNLSSSVLYEDAMGEGIDVRYTVVPGKIKEDVILNQPTEFRGYTMHINAGELTAVKLGDNSVEFQNEDEKAIFTVAAPYMYDSAGAESYDIDVEVKQEAAGCTITFTPDAEWLNAEERVYPITIDPQNDQDGSNYDDTYVHEGDNISGSGGKCTVCGLQHNKRDRMDVGIKSSGGTYRVHRAYFRIINMPALTAGSTISSASMRIWNTDGSSTGRAISLYKNLGGWDNDNLTWNNKPNSYETESRPFNKEYITFSGSHFLSGIRMMYSGEANNGFMLRYTDESKSNPDYNAFYTSNCAFSKRAERPLLTLSYQAPANIANGVYYIRNRKSSLYMDAEQDLSHNGNVIQYTFHGGSNQQWKVEKQSDGYYKLTNLYPQHNGKVLDVASGVITNNQNVQIYASNNTPAQRWAFFSNGDGSYRLMPKAGNQAMCISVMSGSINNAANVHMYDYISTAPEQGWFLEKCVEHSWSYSDYSHGGYVPQKGNMLVKGHNELGGDLATIVNFSLDSNNVASILDYNNSGQNPYPDANNKNCYLGVDITHKRPSDLDEDRLSAVYMITTNVPNPKFDIENDDVLGSRNEESEVTILGSVQANVSYYITTIWEDFRTPSSSPNGNIQCQFMINAKGISDYNNVVQSDVVQANHILGSGFGNP